MEADLLVKVSLVYKEGSRTARATQINPVLKKSTIQPTSQPAKIPTKAL